MKESKPHNAVYDAIHYDQHFTEGLGLTNQILKLDTAKDTEERLYPDIPGAERIEILDDSAKDERRVLGFCHLNYFQIPFPFYYVSWVIRQRKPKRETIEPDDKTIGDIIMERVNTFILEKHLPAILANVIPTRESAHNLYERSGWKLVLVDDKGWRWMVFNLPEGINEEKILEAINILKLADPTYPTNKKP